MTEKSFLINMPDPSALHGKNDSNLEIIKQHFAKLKLVFRGDTVKAIGDIEQIKRFEECLELIIHYHDKFQKLTKENVREILNADPGMSEAIQHSDDDILVYNTLGKPIRARTENQKKLVELSKENDLLLAIGPAGTGKTYTAIALAVKALKERKVKRIILSRPAVEAGENLGFLPGDLKEKLDPYLQPLYDALLDMLPYKKLEKMLEEQVIQIAPLAFMRGRTLSNAFAILDEAQNASKNQLKMFLTRMGEQSQFIVTGDITQIDLHHKSDSGLPFAIDILQDIKGIGIVKLGRKDIIRHHLVNNIVKAYEDSENK
ncbi:MAG: PhoH family protein [Bacteroidota bacterium]|nr:PhoH family protein [Bacteroidota bacterium]